MVLSKLLPRRRGQYTSSSLTVHREDSAALASTRSSKHKEQKYNSSQFLITVQSTYGKSIFLIGAVLMLLTFPLVDKKKLLHLRHQTSFDQTKRKSNEKAYLRDAILADGSLDTHNVSNTKVVTDEQLVSEHITVDEEKAIENNFDLAADVEEDKLQLSSNVRYTHDLAAQAVEPTTWVCGEMDRRSILDPVTNQRPFFAFVHVYKTAGSTVRGFFREYAQVCKKSLALVISCHGLTVDECKLKQVLNAPRSIKSVNSTVLREQFDILGGHFGFGMTDDIFTNTKSSNNGVRHLVFLRQPMARYVSHILFKSNHGEHTVQGVAEYIKNKIRSSRKNGEYVSSIFKYLLTPEQREMNYEQGESKEETIAHKARLSIDNLVRYNAIVGMTETFPQSMKILEQVIGRSASSPMKADKVNELFSRYYFGRDVTRNVSNRNGITTTSVMNELMKDEGFMNIFREFVKYEQLIVDFAMDMHLMQLEAVEAFVRNEKEDIDEMLMEGW